MHVLLAVVITTTSLSFCITFYFSSLLVCFLLQWQGIDHRHWTLDSFLFLIWVLVSDITRGRPSLFLQRVPTFSVSNGQRHRRRKSKKSWRRFDRRQVTAHHTVRHLTTTCCSTKLCHAETLTWNCRGESSWLSCCSRHMYYHIPMCIRICFVEMLREDASWRCIGQPESMHTMIIRVQKNICKVARDCSWLLEMIVWTS